MEERCLGLATRLRNASCHNISRRKHSACDDRGKAAVAELKTRTFCNDRQPATIGKAHDDVFGNAVAEHFQLAVPAFGTKRQHGNSRCTGRAPGYELHIGADVRSFTALGRVAADAGADVFQRMFANV